MKELIEFLEKEGFTLQANNLKNGATSLNFRYDHIGDAGAIGLADALKTNTVLTELNLLSNQIGDAGAIGLTDALKINSSLTSLNLWGNQIGDEGAIGLTEALKINSSFTSLDLCNNQIGAEGARVLAEALKINSSLTSLGLSGNQIGAEGARVLAEALKINSSLTSLDLCNNQIEAEGAIGLAEALKINSSLTSLDLCNNQIGAEGTRVFAEVLKTNSFITSLNLINKIGVIEDKEIEKIINYNKVLFQKLTSLLYNFYTNTDYTLDNPYVFKVLTANKFYQVANKQLLKKYLVEIGVNDIEIKLKALDEFINQNAFTAAGVCKDIQANTKITLGEIHISKLPTEIINNILPYLKGTAWGLKIEREEINIMKVSDEIIILGDVEDLGSAEVPAG